MAIPLLRDCIPVGMLWVVNDRESNLSDLSSLMEVKSSGLVLFLGVALSLLCYIASASEPTRLLPAAPLPSFS